ncbi:winged helix-turn-helix transcriptional regulator [Variovorax arabinosiphilus]|jgi:Lrp/AsnC family leucine-responsive transcriptional regulator|uniref:winged helix-turn-helix transcriptional regulator n=1 Tax=Variovorax arabinosiphilus TaxID=3053498 RepID=UPI0025762BBA|nr:MULTISPECIES: AsnC family transcriptional regulator [unclassified Variovorax]MDM0120052.1 AsnC family transcriptional regulator [Variovorax sp. J2L1-78]MDM0128035.1 AsnC family transcriptional regulator [Variovorax sp. J2L1-63]MDM0231735.1 AsnC family transcriptional regulator [Variovorax sp. J2R1-6]
MIDLDRIDRKILDSLQRNGRISNAELAEQIGLSASACSERVRRLERERVITGYHARVAPAAVGRTLLVFVEIKLSAKSDDLFEQTRRELIHMPELMECHLVSGSFDYLLKFRIKGMEQYRQLLGGILKRLPVSAQSNSYVVMEELKEDTYLVVDP